MCYLMMTLGKNALLQVPETVVGALTSKWKGLEPPQKKWVSPKTKEL